MAIPLLETNLGPFWQPITRALMVVVAVLSLVVVPHPALATAYTTQACGSTTVNTVGGYILFSGCNSVGSTITVSAAAGVSFSSCTFAGVTHPNAMSNYVFGMSGGLLSTSGSNIYFSSTVSTVTMSIDSSATISTTASANIYCASTYTSSQITISGSSLKSSSGNAMFTFVSGITGTGNTLIVSSSTISSATARGVFSSGNIVSLTMSMSASTFLCSTYALQLGGVVSSSSFSFVGTNVTSTTADVLTVTGNFLDSTLFLNGGTWLASASGRRAIRLSGTISASNVYITGGTKVNAAGPISLGIVSSALVSIGGSTVVSSTYSSNYAIGVGDSSPNNGQITITMDSSATVYGYMGFIFSGMWTSISMYGSGGALVSADSTPIMLMQVSNISTLSISLSGVTITNLLATTGECIRLPPTASTTTTTTISLVSCTLTGINAIYLDSQGSTSSMTLSMVSSTFTGSTAFFNVNGATAYVNAVISGCTFSLTGSGGFISQTSSSATLSNINVTMTSSSLTMSSGFGYLIYMPGSGSAISLVITGTSGSRSIISTVGGLYGSSASAQTLSTLSLSTAYTDFYLTGTLLGGTSSFALTSPSISLGSTTSLSGGGTLLYGSITGGTFCFGCSLSGSLVAQAFFAFPGFITSTALTFQSITFSNTVGLTHWTGGSSSCTVVITGVTTTFIGTSTASIVGFYGGTQTGMSLSITNTQLTYTVSSSGGIVASVIFGTTTWSGSTLRSLGNTLTSSTSAVSHTVAFIYAYTSNISSSVITVAKGTYATSITTNSIFYSTSSTITGSSLTFQCMSFTTVYIPLVYLPLMQSSSVCLESIVVWQAAVAGVAAITITSSSSASVTATFMYSHLHVPVIFKPASTASVTSIVVGCSRTSVSYPLSSGSFISGLQSVVTAGVCSRAYLFCFATRSSSHYITATIGSSTIGDSRSSSQSQWPSHTHSSSVTRSAPSDTSDVSFTVTVTPSQSVSVATLSGPRTPSRALSRSRSITMTPSPSLTPTATSSWTPSTTRSDTRSASWTFTVPTHSNISSLTPTSTHSPSTSQSSTSTSTRTRTVSTSLTATVSALRSITLPVLATESVNVSTVSVSSSATVSWCITPVRPGMRLVRQLAMPSTAWTAQSNHDAGVIVDVPVTSASQNGGRLVRFNESFPSISHASEVISIAYRKVSDGTPPSVADFDLILAAPYATYAALSRVTVSATTGALSAVLSIPRRDVLRVHFVFDATAAAVPTYTQQTVSLTLPLRSFACFDPQVYLGTAASSSSLSVAVMFTPVPLAVPLTAVSSTAYASMIVTFVAGSPTTAAVSSRISLLRGYVDCAYDATQDGGFSVTGYYYGPAAGQYLRGAVVGNMALMYGMCVALVALCLLLGCVVACFRQAGVVEASRMILDMMHVPSVFVVPLAQTLQPTVAAAVQLLFARAGDSKGDVLVAVLGLAGDAFFVIFFTVVLLQQQPWSLAPRSSASLEKRLKMYSRVFFWLRGRESRVRDVLARVLFTLFEAKEHWQLADRPEAKRVKRRLLMLFEDTRRMWYPVLDLWSSVALSVIAGFAPLSTSTVCFWQLVLTTALFAALLVVSVVLRPALSNAGTCNLALMNGLNFISTAALLVNSIKVSDAAINVATGALMMTALMSAVVSIPGFIRLFARLYSSMRCVLAAFPPRQWLLKIFGLLRLSRQATLSHEDETWITTVTDDALLMKSCAAVEIFVAEAVVLVHDFNLFDFMRELLLTSIVDQAVAASDASRLVAGNFGKQTSHTGIATASVPAVSHSRTDDDVVGRQLSEEFVDPFETDESSEEEESKKTADVPAASPHLLTSSSSCWRNASRGERRNDAFERLLPQITAVHQKVNENTTKAKTKNFNVGRVDKNNDTTVVNKSKRILCLPLEDDEDL